MKTPDYLSGQNSGTTQSSMDISGALSLCPTNFFSRLILLWSMLATIFSGLGSRNLSSSGIIMHSIFQLWDSQPFMLLILHFHMSIMSGAIMLLRRSIQRIENCFLSLESLPMVPLMKKFSKLHIWKFYLHQ